LYNQEQISPRMWKFFFIIADLYNNDRGIIDEFIHEACVPLINFMQKNPEQFLQAHFEGFGSALDVMFNLIGRIFQVSQAKKDELEAICAVGLIIKMLEAIQGIEGSLGNIINYMISEIARAQTTDYKVMLMQGLCMCLWYNTGATLIALEQTGHTQDVFNHLSHLLQSAVKEDFEIKRIVLGLSQLVYYAASQVGSVPASISNNMQMVMKALVNLSRKSIVVRQKIQEKDEKDEQAEEDKNCEAAEII